jgi:iron complex transport system substrate-binding protein
VSRRLALAVASLALALVPASGAVSATTAGNATGFPVTITAANGKVTVPKRPTRIVSISPTSTESLFAIGAGRQVIAVDDQSDYPKNAPKTALSGFTPNVEAIAAYRPDLVIVAFDPKDLVAALAKLGIPVVYHKPASTIPGAYQQIRQLGAATGHGPEAASLVAKMKAQIARIVAKRKTAATGASVYHELDPSYFSATSKTFVGRVYALFGLENIADAAPGGSDYPQLSPEFIVSSNPDLVVLADSVCCGQNADSVAGRPGWSGIKAVRNRSILRIDDSIASRWGPRLVNFVRAVGSALGRIQS